MNFFMVGGIALYIGIHLQYTTITFSSASITTSTPTHQAIDSLMEIRIHIVDHTHMEVIVRVHVPMRIYGTSDLMDTVDLRQ